ncbi:MAG TPA: helix-turn-helix transcriptional regulator [Acidocella sp.]|nr:helix-turn-helix transcriptional regulator [Acidocella sp.]
MNFSASPKTDNADKNPLLAGLGQRVKLLRARLGMPRRMLAQTAGVSERHLANMESGIGNVSVLVLQQVAGALDCSLAELLGDETTSSPEWLMIRKTLSGRGRDELQQAHRALADLFVGANAAGQRGDRIALVGLRGAGKSTLGRMAAAQLNWPFVELRAEITRLAGLEPLEIQALYGSSAYRRYERQALQETLKTHRHCVIATAGGLVGDPATFDFLLTNCFTIWLQAEPEDHMNRVIAQGEQRQTPYSRKAIEDLRLTLESRAAFYAKADLAFNTSGKTLDEAFAGLMAAIAEHRPMAAG